ncbi:MAG: CidA/LrgA family protein [Geminicoccaceae bacterium]|nr:MAG: CidA/LrgA family protein [Geminicoccaceae bacterium]
MLGFFVLILALLFVGEALSAAFLPIIPGPIIGMALLLGILIARGGVPASFVAPANGLVGLLTLFILPASLGIIAEWGLLGDGWPIFLTVAAAGALLTAAVTALLAWALLPRRQ